MRLLEDAFREMCVFRHTVTLKVRLKSMHKFLTFSRQRSNFSFSKLLILSAFSSSSFCTSEKSVSNHYLLLPQLLSADCKSLDH